MCKMDINSSLFLSIDLSYTDKASQTAELNEARTIYTDMKLFFILSSSTLYYTNSIFFV